MCYNLYDGKSINIPHFFSFGGRFPGHKNTKIMAFISKIFKTFGRTPFLCPENVRISTVLACPDTPKQERRKKGWA